MTRIVYEKRLDKGYLVSQPIMAGHDVYTIRIYLKDNSYAILDSEFKVVKTGDGKSLNYIKQLVKEEIKAMGAKFQDEIRKKI